MKDKLKYVKMLSDDVVKSVTEYITHPRDDTQYTYYSPSYGDRNHGKYAIKRKITLLRQELLNLERMIHA